MSNVLLVVAIVAAGGAPLSQIAADEETVCLRAQQEPAGLSWTVGSAKTTQTAREAAGPIVAEDALMPSQIASMVDPGLADLERWSAPVSIDHWDRCSKPQDMLQAKVLRSVPRHAQIHNRRGWALEHIAARLTWVLVTTGSGGQP